MKGTKQNDFMKTFFKLQILLCLIIFAGCGQRQEEKPVAVIFYGYNTSDPSIGTFVTNVYVIEKGLNHIKYRHEGKISVHPGRYEIVSSVVSGKPKSDRDKVVLLVPKNSSIASSILLELCKSEDIRPDRANKLISDLIKEGIIHEVVTPGIKTNSETYLTLGPSSSHVNTEDKKTNRINSISNK